MYESFTPYTVLYSLKLKTIIVHVVLVCMKSDNLTFVVYGFTNLNIQFPNEAFLQKWKAKVLLTLYIQASNKYVEILLFSKFRVLFIL